MNRHRPPSLALLSLIVFLIALAVSASTADEYLRGYEDGTREAENQVLGYNRG